MRHWLIGAAAAFALVSSPVWAQTSLGVATPPGITFHPPPPAAHKPAPPPSNPPGHHHRAAVPQPGGDLFQAGPHTYAPRFDRRSRHRTRFHLSPYAVQLPYFGPGDYPLGLAAPVATYSSYVEDSTSDAGYLALRVEPRNTLVYVDGFFVGSAGEGRSPGFLLEAGPHRIELRAEGFETATFDVRVRPDDTINYTRDLERPAPLAPNLEPVVAVVRTAAQPKTLYVIPRCYAGDRRPVASELPARCNMADLRVIK